MNRAPSLRNQLLRGLMTLLIPLLLAGVVAAYLAATHITNLTYDGTLFRAALALADQVEVRQGTVVVDLPKAALDLLEYDEDDLVYYRITAPDGQLVKGDATLPLPQHPPLPNQHLYYDTQLEGKPARAVVFALSLQGTSASGVVLIQVAETLTKRELMVSEIMAATVLPQLLMVLLAAALLFYGVKRGLAPLQRLSLAFSQRSHRDLSAVPAETAPQEVQPLLHSFNDLMQRVREAIGVQQRFIADASHQLRTPLAGLQTQAEMALREPDTAVVHNALERINASTARLSHLVSQLLSLARVEPGSGRESNMVACNMVELARAVTADFVNLALAKQIDLGLEAPDEPLLIQGDAVMLREMMANLLDNAITYTQPHGEVTLSLIRTDKTLSLIVEDNGPGIPEIERERVFERFHRLDDSVGEGCGLGLAIVREIALAHQASVSLGAGQQGHGTQVTVVFSAT
ncbi:MAG: sensor histidine kinase [Methylophilaceae bacterium]